MSVRNLEKVFAPQCVAVIGASCDPTSVGYSVVRNLTGTGFSGAVYPVNPKYESVQGIRAYASVADLPDPPDLAVVCTPAHTVPRLIDQCAAVGIGGMIVLSAGFKEIGVAGQQLERQLVEKSQEHASVRILGPNCLGAIVPRQKLNASFASAMPSAGTVAFVSQSGAMCTSVLDWALEENIGFSHFVSVGNMTDISIADLIDYFGEDEQTTSLILYIESITGAREFMSAARAFTRKKPIVAYKSGRFAESAQAAASHTGALAGEDAVYDAAFQRAGIVRAFAIDDLFDAAELLARQRPPGGPRLAIVTNAGGPGVIATDELIARQGLLAQFSEQTTARLNEVLPAYWSHGNPVDVLGDATAERYERALAPILDDKAVDAAVVVVTPQAMSDPTGIAHSVAAVAAKSAKPVLAAWMGAASVRDGIRHLNQASIPTYTNPEHAVRAFMHLVAYARNLEILYETPRAVPLEFKLDRRRHKEQLQQLMVEGPEVLSESVSKELLETYGIPVTRTCEARTAEDAVSAARTLGYPVVLKILSPEITHKTDVGGVALNLTSDADVRGAFERICHNARQRAPQAQIQGVSVQKMVATDGGLGLILGAKRDATFGAVILVGTGGIAAELSQDRALGLPPLNERLARRMLTSLRSWPLLSGYRGRPGVDIDHLLEAMIRFSYFVADYPEIQEFDINPLLVTGDGVCALDARAVLDRAAAGQAARPYAHLVIRPYPEEYTRRAQTKTGTPILLRAIRPEDEPTWHAMLAACSPESIRSRFRYLFSQTTHAMAARFCFIDYDRELAIVAEVGEGEQKKLAGVGRLVADANHETAEYAVLVADPWQGQGLGLLLTEYCLEIARGWGIKRIVAETEWQNGRMLATFHELGFEVCHHAQGIVYVAKDL